MCRARGASPLARTNTQLDNALVKAAFRLTGARTKREVVDIALRRAFEKGGLGASGAGLYCGVAEASEAVSAALPAGFREEARTRLPPALVAALGEIAEGPLASIPSLRIILFGSRATGRGGPRSDFDLGFDAAEPLNARVTTEIRERIDDLPIFQTVDVVDLSQVSAEFRALAESEAIALYERRA